MAQTIKIKRSATSGNKLTGSNSVAGEIGMNTADKSLYIQTGSTNASVVTVYDDSTLHLDDGNNRVGIGTTSPGTELEIAGPNPILRIRENDQTNKFGDILVNSNRIRIRSRAGSNNGSIAFEGNNGTSTTEYARFNSSGYLGIGETTPSAPLHIGGDGRVAIFGDDSFDDKYIELREGGTTGFRMGLRTNLVDSSGCILLQTGDDKGFGIAVNTTAAWSSVATSSIPFYVAEGGNVGIGTTSPAYKLDVNGTFRSAGNAYFEGSNINFSTAGANVKFNGGGGYISTTTAHALRLQTNNTEALRLTSGQDAVFSGDITVSKDDPTITLLNNSGANTDPNGTIIFSEVSGTNNFKINYNGSDDRLEFIGLISSTETDIVYINRSTAPAVNIFGELHVGGHIKTTANSHTISSRKISARDTNGLDLATSDGTSRVTIANNGITTFNATVRADYITGIQQTGSFLDFDDDTTQSSNGVTLSSLSALNLKFDTNNNDSNFFGVYANGGSTPIFKLTDAGAATFNNAFTFPTSDGQANQVLKTDGSGNVTWATEAATSASTSMSDADGDTKIQVEESADEDKIRFDAGGTERFRIGSDIEVVAATDFNITGANRRLNFTSGTGTVRTTGASSLHLATNNTNRLNITSDGKVGIGTTSPASRLQINGTSADGWNRNIGLSIDGTEHGKIVVDADGIKYRTMLSGDHHFFRNSANSTTVLIRDDGRVGIGTTSPSQKLDVSGAAKIRGTGDGTLVAALGQLSNDANTSLFNIYTDDDGTTRPLGGDALEFNTARWGSVFGQTRSSAAGGSVRAWKFQTDTNSNERGTSLYIYTQADASATGSTTTTNDVLISAVSNKNSYINTSGNFGLGTNNPSRKFEVHENNTYLTIGEKTGYSPGTYGPIFETNANALVLPERVYVSNSNVYLRRNSTSANLHGDGGIQFSYYNTTTKEGMRLDNSGRLLINTTSSIDNSAKLQIVGNSGGYARITMEDADGTNQKTFFDHSNGLTSIITQNGTSNGAFAVRGWNGSATTDFVRVASNGNVGIGTTSPQDLLHLSASSPVLRMTNTSDSGKSTIEFWDNQSGTSQSGEVFFEDAGNVFGIQGNANGIIFRTSNTFPGAERMRLNNNGYLGIGTSAPSKELHVKGGVFIDYPNGSGSSLKIGRADTSNFWEVGHAGADFRLYNTASSGSDILFGVDNGGGVRNNNVGIGTATPATKLDVTASGVNGLVLNSDTSATTNSARLFFKASGGTVGMLNVNNSLSFRTGMTINSSSGTERLNINSTHVSSNNTVLLKGANDNSGKADFALNTGGSPTVSLHGNQVQMGSSDMNWNGKISYVSGSGVYFSAWDNDLRLTTSGGASAGARNIRFEPQASGGSSTLRMIVNGDGNVGIGVASPNAKLQVEELGIDTTTTTTSATTQVAIDTMAAATFRSARYTIQITNTTDSSYHITEVLLIHDGTTPAITEYGTVFTGSAAEATIDADISSGNVRLLATPASTDSMTFKVVRHCITV